MAIGWKNASTRPEGRRSFGEAPNVIRREVIPPGKHSDGQDRDGTPAGRMSTRAASQDYMGAAAHRASEGSHPYPGMGGFHSGGENPKVTSKGAKWHGRPHAPGKVGSPGEQARLSLGSLAGKLYKDPIDPSWPQKSQPRTTEHRETVGWLNGVNHAPTHPNSHKHFGGHVSGAHTNTDAAPGQAHSASGGRVGKPQSRPASSEGRRAGANFNARPGKLSQK